jgi:hypothetical protein
MARSSLALAAVASAAIACNNGYQFAPAGRCLIQPGSVQVRLDPTSSADILFVVDDSPSTNEKQAGLAASFGDFIGRMVQANVKRASRGLEPVDFNVAVTTTSVLEAKPGNGWCVGGNSCCQASSCAPVASCTRGTGAGCGAGQTCLSDPIVDSTGQVVLGEQLQCCAVSSCAPVAACQAGDACAAVQTSYPNPFPPASFCTPGLAAAGAPYPAGALQAAGANAKVLDFAKDLDWASWGTPTQDPRLGALVSQFQQNVRVGSCGSGEEQGLEAARLAIEKAAAGQLAGASGFPRPGAKLLVVWVGDEDDCSSPAGAPLVMSGFAPGADSCVLDKHRPAADQREIPVSTYADFFASLAHPGGAASFAAGFIVSAAACRDGSYAPADSCSGTASCPVQPPATCAPVAPVCSGAYAAGERYLALADAFRARGIDVVEGTVCDAYPPASFGPVLERLADIVPPVPTLRLPSQPASRDITSLTIADRNGVTRRSCQQGPDWCFVDCADKSAAPACLPAGTSECIGINQSSGSCVANPGETYSAAYLGVVPAGGCATASDCRAVLGGSAKDWACTKDAGALRGTCTCNSP